MSAGDALTAVITVGIDPEIGLGPLTLTWHGVTIAVGVAAGGWLAAVYARERDLERERLIDLIIVAAIAGIVGARLFWVVEQGHLLVPTEWIGAFGFSIYGAVIFAPLAAAAYMRWRGLGMRYLDALGAGFPLALVVGRIGDLINGEHYGPASDLPWAVQNTHPNALTPNPDVAYHSGGLYEIALGLAILAMVWPFRERFRRAGMLFWTVIALYGAGRFVMFFYRSDSPDLALGLTTSHWTSLALVAIAAVAASLSSHPTGRHRAPPKPPRLTSRGVR